MFAEAQPDAVSICTPPNLHLAVAQAAAAHNLDAALEMLVSRLTA